jgi:hypothetical protein
MESNSLSLRVHISDIAARRVAEQDANLVLKCRGQIPIKGKVFVCFVRVLMHQTDVYVPCMGVYVHARALILLKCRGLVPIKGKVFVCLCACD